MDDSSSDRVEVPGSTFRTRNAYRKAFNEAELAIIESVCADRSFLRDCYRIRRRFQRNRSASSQAPSADINRWTKLVVFFELSRRQRETPKPTVLDVAELALIDPALRVDDVIAREELLRAEQRQCLRKTLSSAEHAAHSAQKERVVDALRMLINRERPKRFPKFPEQIAATEVRRMFQRHDIPFTNYQSFDPEGASKAAKIIGVIVTKRDVRNLMLFAKGEE